MWNGNNNFGQWNLILVIHRWMKGEGEMREGRGVGREGKRERSFEVRTRDHGQPGEMKNDLQIYLLQIYLHTIYIRGGENI